MAQEESMLLPSGFKLTVSTSYDNLEKLMIAYVPVFNAISKDPFPKGYTVERAKQLWESAVQVISYLIHNKNDPSKIVAGEVIVEMSREFPPSYIPEPIFKRLLHVANGRRLFYHTAAFKTEAFKETKELRKESWKADACHFYATIERINNRIVPPGVRDRYAFIGSERFLMEERQYYCLNMKNGKVEPLSAKL